MTEGRPPGRCRLLAARDHGLGAAADRDVRERARRDQRLSGGTGGAGVVAEAATGVEPRIEAADPAGGQRAAVDPRVRVVERRPAFAVADARDVDASGSPAGAGATAAAAITVIGRRDRAPGALGE